MLRNSSAVQHCGGIPYNQTMSHPAIKTPTTRDFRSHGFAIAGWFLVGFAFGWVIMPFSWHLWQESGIGRSLSKGIVGKSFPNLAGYVRVLATQVPDWIAAGLMGFLIGRFKRKREVMAAIACSAGLVFGPELWYHKFTFFLPVVESPATFLSLILIPKFAAVALAASCAVLFVRRRAIPPGHCRSCEYDLTGNESGICPECGAAVVNDLEKAPS